MRFSVLLAVIFSVLVFVSARPDHCNLTHETGKCFAAFEKFYYDASTGECKSFIYGGCGGNDNRFDSEEDCKKTCV